MEFKNTPSPSTDLAQKATTSQDFNSMFNDDCQYFDDNIQDQQQNFHENLTGKYGMMDNSGFNTFNTSNSFDNSDHSQVINCEILTFGFEILVLHNSLFSDPIKLNKSCNNTVIYFLLF